MSSPSFRVDCASGEDVDLFLDVGLFVDFRLDDFVPFEGAPPQRRWVEGEVIEVKERRILLRFSVPHPSLWVSVDTESDRLSELHSKCQLQSEGFVDSEIKNEDSATSSAVISQCFRETSENFLKSLVSRGIPSPSPSSVILNFHDEKKTFEGKWISQGEGEDNEGEGDAEETQVNVDAVKCPLFDPLTLRRLTVPVRGQQCSHIAAFDLLTHCTYHQMSIIWHCPICKKEALLDSLQLDCFLLCVVNSLEGPFPPPSSVVCDLSVRKGVEMDGKHLVIRRGGKVEISLSEGEENENSQRGENTQKTHSLKRKERENQRDDDDGEGHGESEEKSSAPSFAKKSKRSHSVVSSLSLGYPVIQMGDREIIDLTGADADDPFLSEWTKFIAVKKEKSPPPIKSLSRPPVPFVHSSPPPQSFHFFSSSSSSSSSSPSPSPSPSVPSFPSAPSAPSVPSDFLLDANQCDADDFISLGISERQSAEIVKQRNLQRGKKFHSIEHIGNLNEIKQKTMRIIRENCTVHMK